MEKINSKKSAIQPLSVGAEVFYNNSHGHIIQHLDLESVMVKNIDTGISERILIKDISTSPNTDQTKIIPEPSAVDDIDWEIAQERYKVIEPLLNIRGRTRSDVEQRASKYNLHVNTLYKWIKRFEEEGRLTALINQTRSDAGTKRLDPEVEEIIEQCIKEHYLTTQNKKVPDVYRVIKAKCLNENLSAPHLNTIRKRIAKISHQKVVAKRSGYKAASEKFDPQLGSFPGAEYPFAVYQIDHTPLDIILVDENSRLSVGRPWLTLAIDVYSRMVAGFYISFDPPSALAAGMCMAHAMLPKDNWLAKMDISSEWPIWGRPSKIHVDNAKEFRGKMLQRACEQYGITIEWRPVGKANYGGHIERLLGTLLQEIHTLPGTTFSNIEKRKQYKSTDKAILTLPEFEKWLTTYIADVYHKSIHTTIQETPLERYKKGIFGTPERPGTGLPAKISDETRLQLDFMPFIERTVQSYGVVIDGVHYYHDVLRHWINAPDILNPKAKRKFIFKRDPRDISTLWFYEPDVRQYYPIPYRDTSLPAITLWELKEAKRMLSKQGLDEQEERLIFQAYDRMREIEAKAKKKTMAARRANQRRNDSKKKAYKPFKKSKPINSKPTTPVSIQPFEEIDENFDEI